MKASSEREWVLILNVKFYIISYIFLIVFVRILPPVLRKKSGRNLQQSATEHIKQNALQKGRGIMKNQNQVKVFVSVFLALLSIQGTAMTGAAAMESVPLATEQTEQVEEAVTETMPEESAPSDFLSISSNDAIPDIIQGTPIAINGVVKSDFSKITVLTVGVYNAAGEQVIGKTLSPNQVEYDLQNLNDALPFENLQAGTYQYRVTASNATNQNYTVINQSFVVSSDPTVQVGATEDAITIENGSKIPNITVGTSVSISGIVRSASSNITTITVGVYDSKHKMVTGKNAYPTASVFNVKKLDDFVDFSELPVGTYTYEITVTNGTHANYTVVNQKFIVSSSSTATDDSIKITNSATIPNITVGKAVSIRGTVTSAKSNITKITVGVFDANNTLITGNSASPNAKTYNVANMDAAVKFGNLKAGTYYYKVLVTNAAHKDYEAVNQKFTVSESGSSTTTDQIKMTNGVTIPNITAGKSVSIRGTVTSATSNITKLIVGIYREDGTSVTGRTVVPNAKSYDVSKIDPYVKFGGLSAGTYYYKVLVTNATHTNYAVVNQKFTVSGGSTTTTDTLSMTGGVTIPNIKVGNVVSIRGTVTSASSNLKSVTVGVYDSNNKLVTGKTVAPNAKTYNVRNLDAYVSFGNLKAGTYYYKVIASNAANTNVAVVNQKFTVSDGSSTTTDKLSITGGVTIPNIKVGNVVSIRGTVTSASSNLKSVTVGVYDSNNKLVTGKTATPNAKTYNIRNLDAYVSFGDLKAGTYYYKVIASNAANTNVAIVNQKFTVSDGSSTTTDKLSITGGVTIPNIKVGNVVSIRGTVTSASSNLKSVTVGVYDSSNKLVTGKTVAPNAKTYNVRNLDAYVSFGDLKAGTYYYKVITSNAANTNVAVVNQKFTVSDGSSTTTDTLSITGGVTIPNIKIGNVVSIRGTVTSASSNLKSVTVGVYDSNNKLVTGKTVAPNAKTYNVRNLDAYVSFGDLKAGTYYYKVIASNAANTNVAVVNQKFTVSDGSSTTTTDTLSITGGVTIPNIKVGNVVSIRGTVTSTSSNLKSVTVGVYDSNNKLVTGKTATPNAKTYNIRNLDAYVDFGSLKAGTYYYKVFATNATTTNFPVVEQKFTVSANGGTTSNTDTLSITGGTTVPNIKVGNTVVVQGTIQSKTSNITSLTVGVFDQNQKLVTGKTVHPNVRTYNVHNLDYYVNFGDLKAGTYYYKVIATNGAYTNQAVVNQKFTVSDGSSTTTDKLSMTGGVTIPNIKVGNVVSIRGTVTSASSNLKSVTVGVYDSNNNLVTGKTVAPNAKTYNVRNLDAYVSFGDLQAGTYYYRVFATNAANTNVAVVNQKFTVSDGSSTTTDKLSMTGGVTIPNIKVGNVVSIRGTVTSASSNLKSVTAGVYDSNNKLVTGKTATPNAKTYNVSNLDAYVDFGSLKAGTYYYRVFATNATTTNFPVVEQKFTVSANGSTTASDTLSISGGTSVPNITEGTSVVVKGTVSSASSNITSVTVGVYSASGNLITGKTVKPNAKSYDLRKLDAYVNFNLLTPGSYLYRVTVSNGTKTQQLVNQAFQVKAKSGSAQNKDKLTLSGGTTIPNIKVGKAVSIRGTVKSATSNITSLTVGVFSSSGNLVTGKTVRPNAKSYDIHQVDAYVNFNLLSPDTYYYSVIATNGSYQNQIVSYQKFTVTK